MSSIQSANGAQQTVCSRCEQLDETLASIIDEDKAIPADGLPLLSLGYQTQKTACKMCRFFLKFAPKYRKKYEQHVRLFDHIRVSRHKDFSALTALPRSRFLSVLRESKSLIYDYSLEDEIVQPSVLVYSSASLTSLQICSVNPATVDFKLLDSLIADCQGSHTLCIQVENRTCLPYIYLIDCIKERVVREDTGQDYLALSYVWGSSTQANSQAAVRKSLAEDSFSFNEASPTVQDAVRVVRNLGRKYLWVDKYCINHNDMAEQQMMLRNMDIIYEHAEATIVAMFGENAEAGLPGVSGRARTYQPQFRTTHGCFISSCPPISQLIQASKWATRGWTYQEARLSRRCLFFTEHQVYVVCPENTRSESLPSSPQSCSMTSLLNSSRLDGALFASQQTSIAEGFWRDRLAFSCRTLTYESDVLDAFRGILNRSQFYTFWGVPIVPLNATMDPHTGFALGLLWTRIPHWAIQRHLIFHKDRPRIRRANFPTWSWTGLIGAISNDGYGGQSLFTAYHEDDSRSSIQSDVYIQFEMYLGGKPIPLHEVLRQQPSNVLSEESPYLLVHGDVVHLTRISNFCEYCVWDRGRLSDTTFHAEYDLNEDTTLNSAQAQDKNPIYDALILVKRNHSRSPDKKILELMLLDWIRPGLAERRGLLSHYVKNDAEAVDRIPKTRMTFVLQ